MSRLVAQDLDQEVKDCAISCMAAAISQLGDVLKPQLPKTLQASRHSVLLTASHLSLMNV